MSQSAYIRGFTYTPNYFAYFLQQHCKGKWNSKKELGLGWKGRASSQMKHYRLSSTCSSHLFHLHCVCLRVSSFLCNKCLLNWITLDEDTPSVKCVWLVTLRLLQKFPILHQIISKIPKSSHTSQLSEAFHHKFYKFTVTSQPHARYHIFWALHTLTPFLPVCVWKQDNRILYLPSPNCL